MKNEYEISWCPKDGIAVSRNGEVITNYELLKQLKGYDDLKSQLFQANEKIEKHNKEMALAYNAGIELNFTHSLEAILKFVDNKYNLEYGNSVLTYSQLKIGLEEYFNTKLKEETKNE